MIELNRHVEIYKQSIKHYYHHEREMNVRGILSSLLRIGVCPVSRLLTRSGLLKVSTCSFPAHTLLRISTTLLSHSPQHPIPLADSSIRLLRCLSILQPQHTGTQMLQLCCLGWYYLGFPNTSSSAQSVAEWSHCSRPSRGLGSHRSRCCLWGNKTAGARCCWWYGGCPLREHHTSTSKGLTG